MRRGFLHVLLVLGFLLGLPLAGVVLTGHTASTYLEFPPLTRHVTHAPYSWQAFWSGLIVVGSLGWYGLITLLRAQGPPSVYFVQRKPFPWWGWLGLGWTVLWWEMAWSRFPWFEAWQLYTFTPLWLGYIVTVNAWTFRRTGRCLLVNHPGLLAGLFLLSVPFWWCFEYLNRFVQNWYYYGGEQLTMGQYVLHASHAFSTVLPAVMSTKELLGSVPLLDRMFRSLPPREGHWSSDLGFGLITAAGIGLLGMGGWPDLFFPLVWVAPLLLLLGLQMVAGELTILEPMRDGDWRGLVTAALAGLICGFFWELWNVHSLAHWEYAIPFVHTFQIFEMPILGYFGYLPFGLECWVVARLLDRQVP